MEFIALKRNPFPKNRISHKLEVHDILINRYAEVFLAHPAFSTENTTEMTIAIASLREIGLENGGTLNEIFRQIEKSDFKPCPINTGLFFERRESTCVTFSTSFFLPITGSIFPRLARSVISKPYAESFSTAALRFA
jgi:hypothetical protein